jgi:transcriptional regulator with XRE-family HTH domain
MRDGIIESGHVVVSQRLRQRRHELELTQKQVVTRLSRLGVRTTNKTLSCQEHGVGLDVAHLAHLACALDCTTTYLLGLTSDPHRWEPDPDDGRWHRPSEPATLTRAPARRHATAASTGNWILGPVVPPRQPHRNGVS